MLVGPAALLLGNMDQLQSYSVLLPPVAVVYIEYHHGQIIVVVIFLLVRVVLLPPPGQGGELTLSQNISNQSREYRVPRLPDSDKIFLILALLCHKNKVQCTQSSGF